MFARRKKLWAFSFSLFTFSKSDDDVTTSKSELRLQQRMDDFEASLPPDPWKRVKYALFDKDEYGNRNPCAEYIYQLTILSAFGGGMVGGFVRSFDAFSDFIRTNQATKFLTHTDAKKHLQDKVFLSFIKGGSRLAWRAGLFSFMFLTATNVVALYRNKEGVVEYCAGGTAAGMSYRVHLGLRGVIVGGVLGFSLGTMAGVMSYSLFLMTGISMTDVREAHYKFSVERQRRWQKFLDTAEREETFESGGSTIVVEKIIQDEESDQIFDNLEAIEKIKVKSE